MSESNDVLNENNHESVSDTSKHTDDANVSIVVTRAPHAPMLRIEQLKDEDCPSSAYSSEDEYAGSIGDGSDADGGKVESEFQPPDDELRDKIITQVEFYFSDANILKDAFLLKHVRRNKQGYVSIKLITSFKKVKSLTKDYRVVAYSLRQSDKLAVNEEGRKVRRVAPLPEWDETTPSRTVVAVNLPVSEPTIENIAELFSGCGEIALIRIIKPGKSIPADVKKYLNKHPEFDSNVCAVVEFEKHESAQIAVESKNCRDNWRNGLHVALLAEPKKKTNKQDDGNESGNEGKKGGKKRRNRGAGGSRVNELVHDPNCYSSGSEADGSPSPLRKNKAKPRASLSPNQSDPNRLSPKTTPKSSPMSSPSTSPRSRRKNLGKSPLADGSSPKGSPLNSPEMGRRRCNSGGPEFYRRRDSAGSDKSDGSAPSSPWVQRRLKLAAEISPLAKDSSPCGSPLMGRRLMGTDMAGIQRQPKGPDGSKGFYGGAGRGKPIGTSS